MNRSFRFVALISSVFAAIAATLGAQMITRQGSGMEAMFCFQSTVDTDSDPTVFTRGRTAGPGAHPSGTIIPRLPTPATRADVLIRFTHRRQTPTASSGESNVPGRHVATS